MYKENLTGESGFISSIQSRLQKLENFLTKNLKLFPEQVDDILSSLDDLRIEMEYFDENCSKLYKPNMNLLWKSFAFLQKLISEVEIADT